jgi:lysophospholipase L1-like esterase
MRPAKEFVMDRYVRVMTAVIALASVAVFGSGPVLADSSRHWVGTWATSLHQPNPGPPTLTNTGFANQTLRQIVHTSVGGTRARIRLSSFGGARVVVGAAHIAIRDTNAAIVFGSDRSLTFGGEPSVTIPPGAIVVSDPVDLEIPPLADLAVSIFVPEQTGPATWHFVAQQTSYVSPAGNFADVLDMPVSATIRAWFWLAAVEVFAPKQVGAIAAFGDSVTDGVRSTVDANRRWPDYLARTLMARRGNHHMGVLNASITGNRLLHDGIGSNGLARFGRDVLAQTGVTHVIVLLGNNDITIGNLFPAEAVSAQEIVQAHRLLIARARADGVQIIGGTLPPFGGLVPPEVFPALEAKRQSVNEWIRFGGEYDAVVDFDEVLRDPADPGRLLPSFDSGDFLHPNDDGYEAMGRAIDVTLFANGQGRAR